MSECVICKTAAGTICHLECGHVYHEQCLFAKFRTIDLISVKEHTMALFVNDSGLFECPDCSSSSLYAIRGFSAPARIHALVDLAGHDDNKLTFAICGILDVLEFIPDSQYGSIAAGVPEWLLKLKNAQDGQEFICCVTDEEPGFSFVEFIGDVAATTAATITLEELRTALQN
jgi:hypothetical protein